jgi:hypothetical protein
VDTLVTAGELIFFYFQLRATVSHLTCGDIENTDLAHIHWDFYLDLIFFSWCYFPENGTANKNIL